MFLAEESNTPTLFILTNQQRDFTHDIKVLLKAFDNLVAKGHSLVVIEHNMEVIKMCRPHHRFRPEGGEMAGISFAKAHPKLWQNAQNLTPVNY